MILTADHTTHDVTAPLVAVTLAEKVALVERFALNAANVRNDWQVIIDPNLDGWVLRWHYLRLTIGEPGDLDLAISIAEERATGSRLIRNVAARARIALGWPGGRNPSVRCLTCRSTTAAVDAHRPGSQECRENAEERRVAHAS